MFISRSSIHSRWRRTWNRKFIVTSRVRIRCNCGQNLFRQRHIKAAPCHPSQFCRLCLGKFSQLWHVIYPNSGPAPLQCMKTLFLTSFRSSIGEKYFDSYVQLLFCHDSKYSGCPKRDIRTFRLDYEYEIEDENDFSVLVCRLHIITTQTHLIPWASISI